MAKLLSHVLRFIRSLKKSKAPRPAPVGLIKNWDEHPILSTQTSISEFSTSVVNSMKPESLDSDFIYGEGGISDNDERVEHNAVSASKFVKTEHKVSHDKQFMCQGQ
jgi:hypothetical protein